MAVVTVGTAGQRARAAAVALLPLHAWRCQITWIATRQKAGELRAAQAVVATGAAPSERNFRRASERFMSERLQRGER